jgi:phosphoserine phosphatase
MKKLLSIVIACFISGSAIASEMHRMSWNDEAYLGLNAWLDTVSSMDTRKLLVAFDCDNTAWAGDIADAVFEYAVKSGKIDWTTTAPLQYFPKKDGEDPFEYYQRLYEFDPLISYNYAAQAFSDHTLNEIYAIFKASTSNKNFPKAYGEFVELAKLLRENGVAVGFISASPIFLVLPMLDRAGFGATPAYAEGMDIMVEHNGKRFYLSDLIHSDSKLKNFKDVLKKYGDYRIFGMPGIAGPEINAQRGKSIALNSIARRHVWIMNAKGDKTISLGDMRIAGVFGDNFAPFSDMPAADPKRAGNDQGMALGIPLMDGALIANVYKVEKRGGGIDFDSKKGPHDRFVKFYEQLRTLFPKITRIEQAGMYKGASRGFCSASIPLDRMMADHRAADAASPARAMNRHR